MTIFPTTWYVRVVRVGQGDKMLVRTVDICSVGIHPPAMGGATLCDHSGRRQVKLNQGAAKPQANG
jgi:hypothetical protein